MGNYVERQDRHKIKWINKFISMAMLSKKTIFWHAPLQDFHM